MSVTLYGIPNCDTVRKSRAWLAEHSIDYRFHDYKKAGIDAARLSRWAESVGWETLINRAGTTFRKLGDAEKAYLDQSSAIAVMMAHPSVIRRPVVEHPGGLLVGFRADDWARGLL